MSKSRRARSMNSLCVLPMLSFAVERRWLVVGHVTNLLPLAPLSFRVPLSLCSPLPCTSHPRNDEASP